MAKKKKKSAKKTKVVKTAKKKAPAKKAPKKVAKKKAAPKSSKKTAKKSAKKVAKKVAKKPAKKAAPKAAKKSPQKNSAPKAPKAPKAPTAPEAHPLLDTPAPDVTLINQRGEDVNLADLAAGNSKVVLYFYPKDDTPGCTTEACNFRDRLNRLQSQGAVVLGVSPDDTESHQKFIEKHGLNFDLLSDTDHQLADAFGVWKEKQFMGKTYMGVERSTFLFRDGNVAKVWQPVSVEGHVDAVLSALETL